MNIDKSAVSTFVVGHGQVGTAPQQLVASDNACEAYRGVRVRAAKDNTATLYVGSSNVSTDAGYPLAAGEEVEIPVNNPSSIYVVSDSGTCSYSWLLA